MLRGKLRAFDYFIFLNSSVRGPFYPSYMPSNWQWTDAFVQLFRGDVGIVASSITCLPSADAGGYGPKVRVVEIFRILECVAKEC